MLSLSTALRKIKEHYPSRVLKCGEVVELSKIIIKVKNLEPRYLTPLPYLTQKLELNSISYVVKLLHILSVKISQWYSRFTSAKLLSDSFGSQFQ